MIPNASDESQMRDADTQAGPDQTASPAHLESQIDRRESGDHGAGK